MVIKIQPNGDLQFLYADGHPLFELGKLSVDRASNVRFDNETGLWHVWPITADGKEYKVPQGFKRRSEAIACEHELMEMELAACP